MELSTTNAEVLQRFRGRRPSLRSLTGTARESASLYVAWKRGMIQRGDYMAGIRGLAVHSGILTACEQEKMREYMGNLEQQAQALLAQRERTPFGYGSDYGDAGAAIDGGSSTAEGAS